MQLMSSSPGKVLRLKLLLWVWILFVVLVKCSHHKTFNLNLNKRPLQRSVTEAEKKYNITG